MPPMSPDTDDLTDRLALILALATQGEEAGPDGMLPADVQRQMMALASGQDEDLFGPVGPEAGFAGLAQWEETKHPRGQPGNKGQFGPGGGGGAVPVPAGRPVAPPPGQQSQAPPKPSQAPSGPARAAYDPSLGANGRKAMETLVGGLKASTGLSNDQRRAYFNAAQGVLLAMPEAARNRVAANLHGASFYADEKALRQGLGATSAEVKSTLARVRGEIGGAYYRAGGQGALHLDGDMRGSLTSGHATTAQQVYAHEITHAIDGPRLELSKSGEWKAAFAADLSKGQLTKYGASKASEGFAEFGRMLYSAPMSADTLAVARATWPSAYGFFESRGLVPAASAANQQAASPRPVETFSKRVALPGGGHADVLARPKGKGGVLSRLRRAVGFDYDPEQPRDPHGMWTAQGGIGDPEHPADRAHDRQAARFSLRRIAAERVQAALRAPGDTLTRVRLAAKEASQAYTGGGAGLFSRTLLRQTARAVLSPYRVWEGRYGRPAAVAMMGAYLGCYAAYALDPAMMKFIPSPGLMLGGLAEGTKWALRGAGAVADAAVAKAAGFSADEDDGWDSEDLLDELHAFGRDLASASGEEAPRFRREDLRRELEALLAGEAGFAGWDESKHPRGQPGNRGQFGPGEGGEPAPARTVPHPGPAPPRTPEETREALQKVEVKRGSTPLNGGCNETRLVTLADGTKAVFKPSTGEHPGLRNCVPAGGYYRREVAASRVATALGLDDLVPPTVLRRVNGADGSLQAFVPGATPAEEMGARKWDGDRDLARAAALDFVTMNTDRHQGNWLVDGKNKLVLIDNGLAFPSSHGEPEYGNSEILKMAIAQGLPVPAEVAELAGTMGPEVRAALRECKLPATVIDLTMRRLAYLAAAEGGKTTFRDLWKQHDDLRTVDTLNAMRQS